MDNRDRREAYAAGLELFFMDKEALAVLTGTNEQVNQYAQATRRARKLWLAPANPLPLP